MYSNQCLTHVKYKTLHQQQAKPVPILNQLLSKAGSDKDNSVFQVEKVIGKNKILYPCPTTTI